MDSKEQDCLMSTVNCQRRLTLMSPAQINKVASVGVDLHLENKCIRGQVAVCGYICAPKKEDSRVCELKSLESSCLVRMREEDFPVNTADALVVIGSLVALPEGSMIVEAQQVIPLKDFVDGESIQDRLKWFIQYAERLQQ